MIIALLVIGLVCCISSDDQLLGLIGVVRAVLIYTNSVLVFVVLFELVLIPIVGYIILYRKSEYRIFSAVVILFYGVVSGFPLIALILRVSESAGSLEFTIMEANSLIVVFLFPFLVKLPVFGCHQWLPLAHVHASTVGSIYLAGIILKFGGLGLIYLREVLSPGTCRFLSGLGLISFLIRAIIVLIETDVKGLVAIRRVSHIGVFLVLISLNSSLSNLIAIFIMVGHGLTSSALFLNIGCIAEISKSRSIVLCKRLSLARMPMFILTFFTVINNIGLPPLLNFLSEASLFGLILISGGGLTRILICLVGLMISGFYSIYLIYVCCYGVIKITILPPVKELRILLILGLTTVLIIALAI